MNMDMNSRINTSHLKRKFREMEEHILYLGRALCVCGHDFGEHINPHGDTVHPGMIFTDDCLAENCTCTSYHTPRISEAK
jgi:hypothetical protein